MPPDTEGGATANSVQADAHADAFAGSPRLKKLVGLFAPFFDIVAGWLGQLAATLRLPALSAFLIRRLAKRPGQAGAELFVAAALSVTFAELIGPTSQPHPDGNAVPIVTFWYLGQHAKMEARDLIMLAWRKRLAGPALSSWLVDATHKDGHVSDADFQALFEFYHAGWLFLLFLALICLRKDALFIMLGVFAGLTYNMTDYVHGLCYYPWDMPNMFWFTLAWLLYDSKKIWPFLAACCVGGLFKETSLFCALLVLFHQGWGWPKRISGFLGTVIVCFGIDKLMQIHYHVNAPTFAMNNTTSHFDQIFNNAIPENMSYLFSLEPHHVLFSNAGAILIVMLLPWRNYRDFTFKVLLTAFIVCEFCYGLTIEVRVWYEILPLVWALVSEAMTGRFALNSGDPIPLPGVRRFLAGSYWAMIAALLGLAIAYTSVHPSYQAGQAALAAGNETNVDYLIDQSSKYESKYTESEIKLARVLKSNGQDRESAAHLRRVLALGTNAMAANNLAWLLSTSTHPDVRNGPEAVSFALQACQATGFRYANLVATLAAALAESGKFDEAAAVAMKAHDLALASGDKAFAARYQQLSELYKSGQKYR